MSDTEQLKFDQWCLLEIMGHQRYAGRVTEQTIAGASFLRIDIPAVDEFPAFTKLFSASSVYAITPIAEDLVRGMAAELRNAPVSVYDLPAEMREKLQTRRAIVDRTQCEEDHYEEDDVPY